MSMTGSAKLAGIIGWPIAHSLSPRIHGALDRGIWPWMALMFRLRFARRISPLCVNGLRMAGFGRQCHRAPQGSSLRTSRSASTTPRAQRARPIFCCSGETASKGATPMLRVLTASLWPKRRARMPSAIVSLQSSAPAAPRARPCWPRPKWVREKSASSPAIRCAQQPCCAMSRRSRRQNSAPLHGTQWPDAAGDVALLLNATSAGMRGKQPLTSRSTACPRTLMSAISSTIRWKPDARSQRGRRRAIPRSTDSAC